MRSWSVRDFSGQPGTIKLACIPADPLIALWQSSGSVSHSHGALAFVLKLSA